MARNQPGSIKAQTFYECEAVITLSTVTKVLYHHGPRVCHPRKKLLQQNQHLQVWIMFATDHVTNHPICVHKNLFRKRDKETHRQSFTKLLIATVCLIKYWSSGQQMVGLFLGVRCLAFPRALQLDLPGVRFRPATLRSQACFLDHETTAAPRIIKHKLFLFKS